MMQAGPQTKQWGSGPKKQCDSTRNVMHTLKGFLECTCGSIVVGGSLRALGIEDAVGVKAGRETGIVLQGDLDGVSHLGA